MAANISAAEQINRDNFVKFLSPLRTVVSPILYWVLFTGDVFMLVFFLRDFCKRNSHYRKPYYILLVIGFGIHFGDNIYTRYLRTLLQTEWKVPYMATVFYIRKTYFTSFFSFWNATLVSNKFTALWFPLKHDRIWSNNFKKILFVVLTAPVMPVVYIYANFNCIDPNFYNKAGATVSNECNNRNVEGSFIASAFIYILIIFLIILITVFHKKTISSFSPQIAKIEKRLMFQALTSLIFYGICRTIEIIGTNFCLLFNACRASFYDEYYYLTWLHLMVVELIAYVPYLIDISLLLVISNTFRTDFLNFYTFGYYQKKMHKRLFAKTAAVTNLATVVSTTKSTLF